jgi:hypothetical protein
VSTVDTMLGIYLEVAYVTQVDTINHELCYQYLHELNATYGDTRAGQSAKPNWPG